MAKSSLSSAATKALSPSLDDAPYNLLLVEARKIMHLRKYVAKKMKLVKPEEVEILCKGSPVGPELSLEFIRLTRWKEDAKMILEYRRKIVASYE
ncbi:hypothetical protein BBJ28_00004312 [Nothophytophthora sp. Chile5]|nr:hypothetical protein BBJ28_00004312 [Nothophytophthora sp. Chile5]